MQKRFGAEAPRRLQLFQSALSKIRRDAGADGLRAAIQTANGSRAALQKVNDFFNKIPYLTDQDTGACRITGLRRRKWSRPGAGIAKITRLPNTCP
jgi:hypothetical protein